MLQTVVGSGPKCQDFCGRRGFEERHHGGELGDIKPVPEGAIRWLQSNGYGHLVGKLDMIWGQAKAKKDKR
jgi:hypothetical protein